MNYRISNVNCVVTMQGTRVRSSFWPTDDGGGGQGGAEHSVELSRCSKVVNDSESCLM